MSKLPDVLKRAARKEYQSCRQGGYETLITYHERFEAATKAYEDQKNPNLSDKDKAFDFFDGLDQSRYAQFKTDVQNGMTAGSIDVDKALASVNKVYEVAANWIKTQTVQRQGAATTYVTTHLDKVERKPKSDKAPKQEPKQ
mmetsp:Transcript_22454/g.32166  ORF Transcript_22454/g.32166 Transcript_22454/m.32166 type:complete len:142 (+) Transcript_22454:456-881(+)